MTSQQLHAELLLGEKVFALNGLPIGRLEEIRTEINKGHCFVSEFLVGSYAVLERLAAWRIGRALLRVFRAKRKEGTGCGGTSWIFRIRGTCGCCVMLRS
jgi:hypothetical protein